METKKFEMYCKKCKKRPAEIRITIFTRKLAIECKTCKAMEIWK